MTAEILDLIFLAGPYLVFAHFPILLSLSSIRKSQTLHPRFHLHSVWSSLLLSFIVVYLSLSSEYGTSVIRVFFVPMDFLIVYPLARLNGKIIASYLASKRAGFNIAAPRTLRFFLLFLLAIQVPIDVVTVSSPAQAFYLNRTRNASDLGIFHSFLWNRHDRFVVAAIAKHALLTQELALSIAGNGNRSFSLQHGTLMDGFNGWNDYRPVFYWLAKNPRTPETVLRQLAGSSSTQVLFALARNPDTPQDILAGFSKDGRDLVRMQLIYNENIPEKILLELAKDPSLDVREALAKKRNLPASVSAILSRDSGPKSAFAHSIGIEAAFHGCASDSILVFIIVRNVSKNPLEIIGENPFEGFSISFQGTSRENAADTGLAPIRGRTGVAGVYSHRFKNGGDDSPRSVLLKEEDMLGDPISFPISGLGIGCERIIESMENTEGLPAVSVVGPLRLRSPGSFKVDTLTFSSGIRKRPDKFPGRS